MKEAEYARSPTLIWHRRISLACVLIVLLVDGYLFGVGKAVRAGALYVLPLILIWQSDHLAHWAIDSSGQWLSARNADKWVRIAGWVILLMISSVMLMAAWAVIR